MIGRCHSKDNGIDITRSLAERQYLHNSFLQLSTVVVVRRISETTKLKKIKQKLAKTYLKKKNHCKSFISAKILFQIKPVTVINLN